MIKRIVTIVALVALALFMSAGFGLVSAVPAVLVVVAVACRGSTSVKRAVVAIAVGILLSIVTFISRPISALVAFYGNSRRMVVGVLAPPKPVFTPVFEMI